MMRSARTESSRPHALGKSFAALGRVVPGRDIGTPRPSRRLSIPSKTKRLDSQAGIDGSAAFDIATVLYEEAFSPALRSRTAVR